MKKKNHTKVKVYETLHRFYVIRAWGEKGECDNIFTYFSEEKWNGPFYGEDNIDDLLDKLKNELGQDLEFDSADLINPSAPDAFELAKALTPIIENEHNNKTFSKIYYSFYTNEDGYTSRPCIIGEREETDEEFNSRVSKLEKEQVNKEKERLKKKEEIRLRKIEAAKKLLGEQHG